jgi:osmotically inducible protein OsmC
MSAKLFIPQETAVNRETINDAAIYTALTYTHSSDGRLDITLSLPGSYGRGTNPEQLFAAAWSACFIDAMRYVAREKQITVPVDTRVTAELRLCHGENGYYLRAHLYVFLPGICREIAEWLIEEAQETCPYSKATRGNIGVTISLA